MLGPSRTCVNRPCHICTVRYDRTDASRAAFREDFQVPCVLRQFEGLAHQLGGLLEGSVTRRESMLFIRCPRSDRASSVGQTPLVIVLSELVFLHPAD